MVVKRALAEPEPRGDAVKDKWLDEGLAVLIAGIWIPVLGAVTTAALVLYFVVAITVHIRARDFGRNLFVNATGMLAICVAVGIFCFLI